MPKSKYNRIGEVLEEKEKTRYWLAKEADIGYAQLSKYVAGQVEPNLRTLFDIAKTLKVNPKELLNS